MKIKSVIETQCLGLLKKNLLLFILKSCLKVNKYGNRKLVVLVLQRCEKVSCDHFQFSSLLKLLMLCTVFYYQVMPSKEESSSRSKRNFYQ